MKDCYHPHSIEGNTKTWGRSGLLLVRHYCSCDSISYWVPLSSCPLPPCWFAFCRVYMWIPNSCWLSGIWHQTKEEPSSAQRQNRRQGSSKQPASCWFQQRWTTSLWLNVVWKESKNWCQSCELAWGAFPAGSTGQERTRINLPKKEARM